MAKKAGSPDVTVDIVDMPEGESAVPSLDLVPFYNDSGEVAFKGNYAAIKSHLEAWRDTVKKVKFTAEDMDTVTKYKKAAVSCRTSITAFATEAKRKYFNGPKDVFTAMVEDLISIAADVEKMAGKVLDAEEDRRVGALTKVFDIYRDDFQDRYKLSPEGLAQIQYLKQYYNKTAIEAETKADLERQFREISEKEKAKVAGERTIRKLCSANPLLNVDLYLRRLEEADLSTVMDEIEAEEERLSNLKAEEPAREVDIVDAPSDAKPQDAETVKLGVMGPAMRYLSQGSDFPNNRKRMAVEIEYPVDLGDALSSIFRELVQYGIKTRQLQISKDVF